MLQQQPWGMAATGQKPDFLVMFYSRLSIVIASVSV